MSQTRDKKFRTRSLLNMGCNEIDMTLALNFEWLELRSILNATSSYPAYDKSSHSKCYLSRYIQEKDFIFALAHSACHQACLFQERIEYSLYRQHLWAIRKIRQSSEEAALRYLRKPLPAQDLPGVSWALLSDPRPPVMQAGMILMRRALYASYGDRR